MALKNCHGCFVWMSKPVFDTLANASGSGNHAADNAQPAHLIDNTAVFIPDPTAVEIAAAIHENNQAEGDKTLPDTPYLSAKRAGKKGVKAARAKAEAMQGMQEEIMDHLKETRKTTEQMLAAFRDSQENSAQQMDSLLCLMGALVEKSGKGAGSRRRQSPSPED